MKTIDIHLNVCYYIIVNKEKRTVSMNFPGTTIEKTKSDGKTFLGGMFIGTGGLVMKQICALTGLNTPAIQNWVNRGWISHPVGKTYNKDQVARIFIINYLRDTMRLEDVAKLLYFVNGVAGDERDDIIPESKLYGYICEVSERATPDTVDEVIDEVTTDFFEKKKGDVVRLRTALKIIYYSGVAREFMQSSYKLLRSAVEEQDLTL